MRKYLSAIVGGVLLAGTAVPAAALTFGSNFGAPDPGPRAGESILVNFDAPLAPGYTLVGGNLYTGSSVNAAAPAGDSTRYLAASPGNSATLLFASNLSQVSFYWGSIDDYNTVQVLGMNGTVLASVTGATLPPANGNQGLPQTNVRAWFVGEGDEVITGLRFNSTRIAFEVDDVAGILADGGSGSTVPEPASWALMIVGFGLIGVSSRRRARATSVSA